jgi:hypothetical protein
MFLSTEKGMAIRNEVILSTVFSLSHRKKKKMDGFFIPPTYFRRIIAEILFVIDEISNEWNMDP